MATLFTHAVAATAIGAWFRRSSRPRRLLALAVVGAIAPDADYFGFAAGIPYESLLGHRGLTHSLAFAAAYAWLGARQVEPVAAGRRARLAAFACLFLATASHGLLDAMTNGGLGIAFLSPFSNERFFLPWRPIWVAPLGVARFFTARGLDVLRSELLAVWGPAALVAIGGWLATRRRKPAEATAPTAPAAPGARDPGRRSVP